MNGPSESPRYTAPIEIPSALPRIPGGYTDVSHGKAGPEYHRGPHSLDCTECDDHHGTGRERDEERGGGEHRDSNLEYTFPPINVAQFPEGNQEDRSREEVRGAHPREGDGIHQEIGTDAWKGDIDRRTIEWRDKTGYRCYQEDDTSRGGRLGTCWFWNSSGQDRRERLPGEKNDRKEFLSLPCVGRIDETDTFCGGYPSPHPHVRCHAAARKNTARLIHSQNFSNWVLVVCGRPGGG